MLSFIFYFAAGNRRLLARVCIFACQAQTDML